MIDKWFLEDIKEIIGKRKRVVIIDPEESYSFLLPLLEKQGYVLIKTDKNITEEWQMVKEELFLRCKAETRHKKDNVIFYATREQNKLSFLFDYCFTHGCLDLSNPEWIKRKILVYTGIQPQMDFQSLVTVGKMGMGKDTAWWKKKLQNLEDLISIEDMLLPFLNEPENYLSEMDEEICKLFEKKIFEILEQPYISKPAKTLAEEVARKILDGLAYNDIEKGLLEIYYRWADSERFRKSLKYYINNYNLDKLIDPLIAHPDHCFDILDQKALKQITKNLRDKSFVSEKLKYIKIRYNSKKVKRFVPEWWKDIITLVEFDINPLNKCSNLSEVVYFYTEHFYRLDRAIRNLYSIFLHDESIIRPIQEYYENLNYELLESWFRYCSEYNTSQQSFLPNLLKKAKKETAIIVGDGIRFEIAEYIAKSLKDGLSVEKNVILADIPSETEHNMSALYVGNNEIIPLQKDREKRLGEICKKDIKFMNLDKLNYGVKADYLILSYKDIDNAGEKMQQGALKIFEELEKSFIDKILMLFKIGYKEVHLVTDHGFVLTGLLDEADKIEVNIKSKKEIHERFIRTEDKPNNDNWIIFPKAYGKYNYICMSKSHRPFKSKGVYGFAHGGFTPQEIIIPHFIFHKTVSPANSLNIKIKNKEELGEVAGDIFNIKLQSEERAQNLFALSRRVYLVLYAGNNIYCKSNIINMEPNKHETLEFTFNKNKILKAILLDAETQEQLDMAIVKKSDIRDLDGL